MSVRPRPVDKRAFPVALLAVALVVGALIGVAGLGQAAPAAAAVPAPSAPGAFAPVSPTRLLDTRAGVPVGSRQSVPLHVTGRAGVPSSNVSAVVLNVTVTRPAGDGYVSVFPAGGSVPLVSNLNFVAGQTVPNAVLVPVNSSGDVSLFNGSFTGPVDLIADISGYFLGGAPSAAGAFAPVSPTRLLDTRAGAPVGSRQSVPLHVTGRAGVPSSNVSAVVLNVTVTRPAGDGYVSVFPAGGSVPLVSNLNFVAGQTVPNAVVVPVNSSGDVSLFNGSSTGPVDLIADISGYFLGGAPSAAGAFAPVSPTRLLDTRGGVPVGSRQSVALHVTGRAGVPSSNVSAVVLNVTVTRPAGDGFVSVFPAGGSVPLVSNLNFVAGQTVPNAVVVPVNSSGDVSLFNGSFTGPVDLIADVSGYFLADSTIAPPPVTAPAVVRQGTTSLALQWTDPTSSNLAGVMIRRAVGTTAPASPRDGSLVADITDPTVMQFTDRGLAAGTTYSYALFAHSSVPLYAPGAAVSAATSAPLAIATSGLQTGVAGMTYLQALTATGGVAPYRWSATGLPGGLQLSPDGVISGFPAATGDRTVTVTVTDAENTARSRQLTLSVPTALPAGCQATSCAQLAPDGQTVEVPAADLVGVTRDPSSGAITGVTTAHTPVTAGDILVLPATAQARSGAVLLATSVSSNQDGSTTTLTTPATPADAYSGGTVQALATHPTVTQASTIRPNALPGGLDCGGGVTAELKGLAVQPSLTPGLTAIWSHPYFGGGGVFVGSGGLSLFSFDLDGTITVTMGVSVSGSATCTMALPGLTDALPAGPLGAVVLDIAPSLKFTVNGRIDIETSVTLRCGAEYRWDHGSESRTRYCYTTHQPLGLSADSGLDATLTGSLDASVTLDEVAGITGSLEASVHAKYRPLEHPVAEMDASADYELGACLACFWKDSPAQVTLVSGEIFHRTIGTWDTAPPTTAPVIITTDLPLATVGQLYSTQLTTADHRVGTWAVAAGALPAGLSLTGYTISGTPTKAEWQQFTLRFTDSTGHATTAPTSLTVVAPPSAQPGPQPAAGGTPWAWGGNSTGTLGDGTTTDAHVPVQVSGLTGVLAVAGGSANGYALTSDGQVWAWGTDQNGQLGDGAPITGSNPDSNVPVRVVGLSRVTAIASSSWCNSAYAITSDGHLWAWGSGNAGQLGDGAMHNSSTPVQVSGLSGVTAVACAGSIAYALTSDGRVWAWGTSAQGALGSGDGTLNDAAPTPRLVFGLSGIVAIAAADETGYAVSADGHVWAWGGDFYGQLGNGASGYSHNTSTPAQVTGLSGVTSVAAGHQTAYARTSDGHAWAWGFGYDGELGNGISRADSAVPVQVSNLTGVAAVSGGANSGYALTANGSVWAWGSNTYYGELGNGTTTDSAVPVQVQGLSGATAVSGGGNFAFALVGS